ncbi:MAG: VWA domain-containing protein [Terracidiphilus sp.]
MSKPRKPLFVRRHFPFAALAAALLALAAAPLIRAQTTTQTTTQPATQQTQPAQQTQQQPSTDVGPAAGGPEANPGAIAIPKKKQSIEETAPPAPPPPKFKNPVGAPNYSLQLQVPEVVVDVGVLLQKTGNFVPGLKPGNFRVYENGQEQKLIGFKRIQAPITALLLCEYAARGFLFRVDMLNAAWAFTQQLRPEDYVAMMTFDLNSHIVLDFTQDKNQLQQAINMLANEVYMPAAFSETDIFDALNNALDRLSRIPGQKYIILIASGIDSFSKLTFDKILQRVKESQNVTIFTISTGGLIRAMTEGQPGMGAAMRDMDYLQADNEMRTFASLTGGRWFSPRFEGELPDDMAAINESIRSKYELVYTPTDAKQDGTYRKLRVELVDDEGQPLRMQDEKHRPLKYTLIYRDGYRAKPEVQ